MGRIVDIFRIEMRRDLYETYLGILESGECSTQHEAIEKARRSCAPQFYTTSKNACWMLTLLYQGRDTGLRVPEKIRKFDEIKRRVDEMKSKEGYPGLLNACREVVNQPAPEYYICHNTAKQMILEERKRRQDEMARRWAKR